MFFAHFRDYQGKDCGGVYYDKTDGPQCNGYDLYHAETFSPDTEHVCFIDFHVHGKSYQDRKNCVEQIAVDYSHAWNEYCFSYSELDVIGSWFQKMGRRYGLLREFRENAIC